MIRFGKRCNFCGEILNDHRCSCNPKMRKDVHDKVAKYAEELGCTVLEKRWDDKTIEFRISSLDLISSNGDKFFFCISHPFQETFFNGKLTKETTLLGEKLKEFVYSLLDSKEIEITKLYRVTVDNETLYFHCMDDKEFNAELLEYLKKRCNVFCDATDIPEMYLFVNDRYEKTNLPALKVIHDGYPRDQTGLKDAIVFYIKDRYNHMLEFHYGCENTSSPDGCEYCASGFSKCRECGAEDSETEGIEKLAKQCEKKPVIAD